jgi:hypothetical protein
MISFLRLLQRLAGMFIFLSLIHIPLIYIYSKGDFKSTANIFVELSVGNLGQAETRCLYQHLAQDSNQISCTSGTISEITYFGVLAPNTEADLNNRCYTDYDDIE